jgi:hypothetical protein
MADAAQLPRLRALGVTAGEQSLTRVQTSFILSALEPPEAPGVNVRAIADAQRIADPSARRRHLLRCRRALNNGARQAQQVTAAVKSPDESIIHAKALVTSSISVLRAIIDERLGTPTAQGSA